MPIDICLKSDKICVKKYLPCDQQICTKKFAGTSYKYGAAGLLRGGRSGEAGRHLGGSESKPGCHRCQPSRGEVAQSSHSFNCVYKTMYFFQFLGHGWGHSELSKGAGRRRRVQQTAEEERGKGGRVHSEGGGRHSSQSSWTQVSIASSQHCLTFSNLCT